MCVCFLCFFLVLPICFLKREKKGLWLEERRGGEDLGEDKAGKTMVRLYCINKSYFPLKKIKQTLYMDIQIHMCGRSVGFPTASKAASPSLLYKRQTEDKDEAASGPGLNF